jgi:phosphoglycerate dehydrogenase-like enzyme
MLSSSLIETIGAIPAELDDLLRASDIVTLHIPLTPTNRHLIDARRLALMKPTAFIVNTSRGGVIDEAALIQALKADALFGAALDVLELEPPADDHPIFALDPMRIILTPHFAASSEAVTPTAHRQVAEAMASVLRGEWPTATMNPWVIPKQALRRV